jgi:glyoxylase-like metal-dependent hydrolase (beta-lactamase superfamily II)
MLNRRDFLAATAAVAATGALPVAARAPFAGTQVSGIQRRKVGDIEVTAILDGYAPLGVASFRGADAAEVTRLASEAGLPPTLPTSVNAFVVNTGQKTYLVDTGSGAFAALGDTMGRAETNLRAAGIDPAQIDTVILTHAHPDHAEGLVTAQKAARFPNAELVIHEAEYAFWHDDGVLSRAPAEMKPFFASARDSIAPYAARTRRVKAGEVAPGLTLEHAPGHTPGHSILRISSGREQLLLVADSVHNSAIQTARPDVTFVFDADPAEAVASRRRVLDMAAADNVVFTGAHMPFPGFGRVKADGRGFRFLPAEWSYTL